MASGNGWRNNGPQRYRKRRPLPALILIVILGVAATIVWLRVMDTDAGSKSATNCDPPAPRPTTSAPANGKPAAPTPTLGQALENDSLDRTTPLPPGQALVRVLNAGTKRGGARIVTENLRQLGFTQVAEPENDPLYADTMTCRAQIRFGPQGTPAARTLSLIEPCAELIRDDRKDATVDLAIGKMFDDLRPNSQSETVIEQLSDWAAAHPKAKGGLQASGPQPKIDAKLLAESRKVTC
ncbi:envelope integrity protein Cei [Actinophytocola sp.]|uniref:envelope integrity protein Cei n=1 Tax=Actinophytocola sp. TaxID=1872138 RepID=UPI003D6A1575